METALTLQGRRIGSNELSTIRELIAEHPDWHRTRLSQALCARWAWVNQKGQLQDMAARSVLRKLHDAGLIELPAPVQLANNAFRNRTVTLAAYDLDRAPIETRLSDLQPIRIRSIADAHDTRLFRGLLQQYHYLGYRGPVGENLQYLIHDRHGRLLGCQLWGSKGSDSIDCFRPAKYSQVNQSSLTPLILISRIYATIGLSSLRARSLPLMPGEPILEDFRSLRVGHVLTLRTLHVRPSILSSSSRMHLWRTKRCRVQ